MSEPVRSCVACRERRPRRELLRFVADPGGALRLDPLAREGGRGAYACASAACLGRALSRGAFARQLRRPARAGSAAGLLGQVRRGLVEAVEMLVEQGLADGRAVAATADGAVLRLGDRDVALPEGRLATRVRTLVAQMEGLGHGEA